MHRIHNFLAALVVTSALVGCAASSPTGLPLAPPLGPDRHIVQKIRAAWPGGNAELICVLELSPHAIAMAGLTSDGLSLFDLRYDGENLALEKSPLLPDYLPPELIIGDLQLVYWPLTALQKSLPPEWHLQPAPKQRILFKDTRIHAEVDYLSTEADWPRQVQLQNHAYHYQLRIDTLEYDAVPQ